MVCKNDAKIGIVSCYYLAHFLVPVVQGLVFYVIFTVDSGMELRCWNLFVDGGWTRVFVHAIRYQHVFLLMWAIHRLNASFNSVLIAPKKVCHPISNIHCPSDRLEAPIRHLDENLHLPVQIERMPVIFRVERNRT